MIGIFFLVAIGLWAWIAWKLGTKIPQWFGATRFRTVASVVLVPLIFVAPVVDEVIAYPQLQEMCHRGGYELAMNEKDAYGRKIYYTLRKIPHTLWPSTVVVEKIEIVYVDSTTKEPVLVGRGVRPVHGFLALPAGSSGDKMTVLLSNCKTKEALDVHGIPTRFSHLKFNVVPTP